MVDLGVVGVGALEVVDLASEVSPLVLTGDSSVEEDLFRGRGAAADGVARVEERFDISSMIQVLAAWCGDGAELALGVPAGEGLTPDAILGDDLGGSEVANVPYCDGWCRTNEESARKNSFYGFPFLLRLEKMDCS